MRKRLCRSGAIVVASLCRRWSWRSGVRSSVMWIWALVGRRASPLLPASRCPPPQWLPPPPQAAASAIATTVITAATAMAAAAASCRHRILQCHQRHDGRRRHGCRHRLGLRHCHCHPCLDGRRMAAAAPSTTAIGTNVTTATAAMAAAATSAAGCAVVGSGGGGGTPPARGRRPGVGPAAGGLTHGCGGPA